ncbi:MAG: hypothetical protein HYU67_02390 [Flavobacteriia bacterium]|nr:hypothetical protein [Flavobacteriia bacterium]
MYKNLNYKFILIIVLFVSFSCKNEIQEKKKNEDKKSNISLKNQVEEDNKNIEVLFDKKTFDESSDKELLKELGIEMCNPNEKDLSNFKLPACDPKFFKLFPLKYQFPKKNGFILLVKSLVHDFPLRRVFIFQREKNKLVKVNGFIGNLIGKRPKSALFDDIIIRFSDTDQNHFNCLYEWRNRRYEYVKVEQINDANIKKEFQDSMNVEILKWIELNRMQF